MQDVYHPWSPSEVGPPRSPSASRPTPILFGPRRTGFLRRRCEGITGRAPAGKRPEQGYPLRRATIYGTGLVPVQRMPFCRFRRIPPMVYAGSYTPLRQSLIYVNNRTLRQITHGAGPPVSTYKPAPTKKRYSGCDGHGGTIFCSSPDIAVQYDPMKRPPQGGLRRHPRITPRSCLPCHPSSALRLRLHRPGHAPFTAP